MNHHQAAPEAHSARRRWVSVILTISRATLGIALLVYVLRAGGAWESLRGLLAVTWLLLLLNAIPIAGAAIEGVRLTVLFGAQGLKVSFSTGFRVVAIGTLFSLWLPGGTGGDIMKLFYLSRRHPSRGIEILTTLFVDRVVALFALLVLLLALLLAQFRLVADVPVITRALGAVTVSLVLLLAATLAVWSSRIRGSAAYRFACQRLPLGRQLERAADAAHVFKSRRSALGVAVLYSLVGHALLAVSMAAAGRALMSDTPVIVVVTLSLLGLIANVVPVTPGGIGVGEAASEALFRAVGVRGGAALVAAWRAGMIALSLVGAGLYMFGDRPSKAPTAPVPLQACE